MLANPPNLCVKASKALYIVLRVDKDTGNIQIDSSQRKGEINNANHYSAQTNALRAQQRNIFLQEEQGDTMSK